MRFCNISKEHRWLLWCGGAIGVLLIILITCFLLLGNSGAVPPPEAPIFASLREPEVWIMAGYHNELQQDSIPLKDFPRSRPNYSSIRGLYGPNFNLAVTLQEEDSGTLTWQITANEECFVVSNWRSSGALEEVIWRGPFWAVKVVRHKEVWP